MTQDTKKICLGAFAGAHGVKGEMKIKTFTETPGNIAAYGPVESEDGSQRFSLKLIKLLKADIALVRVQEVKSREEADALKGIRLYVSRDILPAPDEEEFYLVDLIGLKAVDETGASLGVVGAVYNFGAGDLLELKNIPGVKGVHLVTFTKENVPSVNIDDGIIVVLHGAIDGDDGGIDPRATKEVRE